MFAYPLILGVIISSLIAVGLLAWALVLTLKQPEVSTFEEVCVKKSHQEENELLVFLEANFKITQSVNTLQSINDEHVSGVICRHIQSNQEFSGNFFEWTVSVCDISKLLVPCYCGWQLKGTEQMC